MEGVPKTVYYQGAEVRDGDGLLGIHHKVQRDDGGIADAVPEADPRMGLIIAQDKNS